MTKSEQTPGEQTPGRRSADYWAALSAEQGEPVKVPDTPEARAAYEAATLRNQIKSQLGAHMAARGISEADLAETLGKGQREVSAMLDIGPGTSLSQLANVLGGLGVHADIQLTPAVGEACEEPESPEPQS